MRLIERLALADHDAGKHERPGYGPGYGTCRTHCPKHPGAGTLRPSWVRRMADNAKELTR